ncbi:MAG: hypothetical protein JSW03_04405 [Candidatus Eiseniibacteriota bacterium]|nr:MAG: hypothetical protein JSW03_04405 [Candidatus Eisenbacteria bacterium]
MYAVCVIWPFKMDPATGQSFGGLAALIIIVIYLVGLFRRLRGEAS